MESIDPSTEKKALLHVLRFYLLPWKSAVGSLDEETCYDGIAHRLINIHPDRDAVSLVLSMRLVCKRWESIVEKLDYISRFLVKDEEGLDHIVKESKRIPVFRVIFKTVFDIRDSYVTDGVFRVLEIPPFSDPSFIVARHPVDGLPDCTVEYTGAIPPEYFAWSVRVARFFSKSVTGVNFLNGYPRMIREFDICMYSVTQLHRGYPFRVPEQHPDLFITWDLEGIRRIKICMPHEDFVPFIRNATARPKGKMICRHEELKVARRAYWEEEALFLNKYLEHAHLSYKVILRSGIEVSRLFQPPVFRVGVYGERPQRLQRLKLDRDFTVRSVLKKRPFAEMQSDAALHGEI